MSDFIFNRRSHKILGVRISAIFETLIFLVVLTLLNYLFGEGERFIDTNPHPYWIIILLISVQYGTAEGILAVILCTIFLYAGNIPVQQADESLFEYQVRLGLLPALWFIVAFVLGELHMRLEWENEHLRTDYVHAKSEVEKITAEYQTLKETNLNLEVQLTSQEDTTATSFRVFKTLESLAPAQIVFGLNSIINLALHPQKFSVFAKGPQGLEAVTSEGWSTQSTFCRRFVPSSALYQAIVEEKKLISIVNKEEQKILNNEGVLAAPLIDPDSGEVFGMIKIEEIDFYRLNLSRLETFKIVCELTGRAYANAKKHHQSLQFNLYALAPYLYSQAFYKEISGYMLKIAELIGFPLANISIQLLKGKQIEEKWLQELHQELPDTAKCFEGTKKMKELCILCPLVKVDDADKLKDKVEQWLYKQCGVLPNEATVKLEMLFHKAGWFK